MDRLNPQVRQYLIGAMNNAKSSHWFNWAADAEVKEVTTFKPEHTNDQYWDHDTNSPAHKIYLQLTDTLNEVTYTGEWIEVTQERINQFAAVTEDEQWIHTDPERAAIESPFRTTVAHGFLTLSLIPRLMNITNPEVNAFSGAKMVVNLGLNRVRYPYPVKAGSRLRGSKKVIEVQRVKRGLEVTEEITVEIEGCRRPACIAQTVVLLVF
ncbi:MaoC family dehydratase [Reinekea marinisedimentorum]|nr:MaoC family dehydratase [Reinekea marinisedimentorum]